MHCCDFFFFSSSVQEKESYGYLGNICTSKCVKEANSFVFLIGYLSCLTYKLWSNKATELIDSLADGSEITLNHISLSEVRLGYCRDSICKKHRVGSVV